MNHRKISIVQTCLLLMLTTAMSNQVLVIPLLLASTGRDAWISVLLTIVPGLCIFAIIAFIMKTTSQAPLIPWIKQHFGRFMALIVGISFSFTYSRTALLR
ncbi:hypothetical protein EJC50_17055 [Paenibacillus albus]|uniref:Uncharacterized protein n=1 Tax=Paenibacillus albus TaxID=2495582 RepID=A0A3Q8X5T0_9BACL|nr:hypothetical protein EJC50_17055 [Paenibacillus albus]